jgi:16S rRNA processing protein RimM
LSGAEGIASEIVVFGKVVDSYGLRGAVKIYIFADDPPAWARLPEWWLGNAGCEISQWRRMRVARNNLRGERLTAELEGVSDRNASEALRGMLVGVPRDRLPPVEKNEYYWDDLIGLEVVNAREESLGHVRGFIETPANDVFQVGDADGIERLLPFVAAVVLDVDLSARRIRVDWELDW